jgi:hypothetical protein
MQNVRCWEKSGKHLLSWSFSAFDAAADGAAAGYLAALVVNQICGVPLTPAFSIVVFRSGDDAKALALSAVLKSCVTVASFALSTD